MKNFNLAIKDFWNLSADNAFRVNKPGAAILISLIAALLFLFLSSVQLDRQGLYFDEVHQATASFNYIDQPSGQFANLKINGLPVLNMNYSGALKTGIYGLYLRLTGKRFSVVSWRLVGLIFVSIALLLFGVILRKIIPPAGLICFYFLTITDMNLMLTARHDWGPVALALALRIIFIALWAAGELSDKTSAGNTFWLGCLLGIMLFEKLSSLVLVIPVSLFIILSAKRKNWRYTAAYATGGMIGASPLIYANIYTFINQGSFISLQNELIHRVYALTGFLDAAQEYLALGAGTEAQFFILGNGQPVLNQIELLQVSLLIILMVIGMIRFRKDSHLFRLAGVMLACYAAIMVSLYFLPQNIWIHHWIIGTPFQYLAVSLVFWGGKDQHKIFRYGFTILLVTMTLSRLIGLVTVEQSLARGDASISFDPSYNQLGELAASKAKQAYFIAEDWGVYNQIICFLNGKPGILFQLNQGSENIDQVVEQLKNGRRTEAYLLFPYHSVYMTPEKNKLALDEIERLLGPDWQEQITDESVRDLKTVNVIKIVRVRSSQ